MNIELSLLRLLLKEASFKEYYRFVNIPASLREVKILYHSLEALHTKYPGTDKTVADLEVMVHMCYPQMREPEKEAINALCRQVKSIEVSDVILLDLVRQVQMRSEAQQLAIKALEVSEGRNSLTSLQEIWERIQKKSVSEDELDESKYFVTDDLFELEKHTIMGPGLRWRLNSLNLSLGPLRVGDFGFVFARPESGKTTFLADQCTHFAGQTDKPIVWFNNEEQGQKVRLRTYQAALALRTDQLWTNKEKTLKDYREITKGNLHIYDDATIHRKDVERVIEKRNPCLIVFDQIDKIKGFDADRPDIVFGRIYQWARELAKNRCAVVGTCQADGTGEGVRWLTMSNVAEAKTSKQAEADWILGIGKSNDGTQEDVRFLNISKNKLLGDKDTDPNLRHGRFEVFLKPQIARYEDMI
jgi:hypothetical protein